MRKCIFLITAVLLLPRLSSAAGSPIDKGSIYLGGTLSYQSQNGDLWENMEGEGRSEFDAGNINVGPAGSLEVSPTAGLFLTRGLLLGAQTVYIHYSYGGRGLT